MNRFLPKSLFGQTILILLFGLVISHAIGAWIYAGAREQAVRAIGGFAAAQRVANLSRLVEEAPAEWRSRIADAGLPVTMEPASPLIYDCQPGALKRAIANLLDNAVKYGKSAKAKIGENAKAIEITIDDEGPGIPDAELPLVFQPFYRVEDSRNRDTGGTGLGLAIAQSVVQAHGGELTLANRPGGGLHASINLPM